MNSLIGYCVRRVTCYHLLNCYSGHLSFSFAFFVHGESTVCASVDVRQHLPVRTLIRAHLQQAQACLHSGTGVQGECGGPFTKCLVWIVFSALSVVPGMM